MQEELDSLAKEYPDRFKIYYVLNQVHTMFFSGFNLMCVSNKYIAFDA